MDNFQVYLCTVSSDKFLAMSAEAQLLYFHLCAYVKESFVYNVKATLRFTGISEDALNELIENEFLVHFADYVYKLNRF